MRRRTALLRAHQRQASKPFDDERAVQLLQVDRGLNSGHTAERQSYCLQVAFQAIAKLQETQSWLTREAQANTCHEEHLRFGPGQSALSKALQQP